MKKNRTKRFVPVKMAAPCGPGNHKWITCGVTGSVSKRLECEECGVAIDDVPLTSEEKKHWDARLKTQDKRVKHIHTLGWKYQDHFYKYSRHRMDDKEYRNWCNFVRKINRREGRKVFGLSRFREYRDGFKWQGYELMEELRKFAKKHKIQPKHLKSLINQAEVLLGG